MPSSLREVEPHSIDALVPELSNLMCCVGAIFFFLSELEELYEIKSYLQALTALHMEVCLQVQVGNLKQLGD